MFLTFLKANGPSFILQVSGNCYHSKYMFNTKNFKSSPAFSFDCKSLSNLLRIKDIIKYSF